MDDIEQVVVLRTHLEEWETMLRWAYGHFTALDLADNYREGRPQMKSSRMTKLTNRALTRVEGYLNDGSDELSAD